MANRDLIFGVGIADGRECPSMSDDPVFVAAFRRTSSTQDFPIGGWIGTHARLEPPGPDGR